MEGCNLTAKSRKHSGIKIRVIQSETISTSSCYQINFIAGKKHYNEFQAVKMARQLMVDDDDDEGDTGACDTDNNGGEKSKHSDSERTESPMDTGAEIV